MVKGICKQQTNISKQQAEQTTHPKSALIQASPSLKIIMREPMEVTTVCNGTHREPTGAKEIVPQLGSKKDQLNAD
jgi:hypothetical protein